MWEKGEESDKWLVLPLCRMAAVNVFPYIIYSADYIYSHCSSYKAEANNISLGSKVKLMRSLVISIFLYACESWTLTAELEKRTQAFEMRCYRRLLSISYKDHVTNEEVRRKIQTAIREYDELLTLVKKRKLGWFGHISRFLV